MTRPTSEAIDVQPNLSYSILPERVEVSLPPISEPDIVAAHAWSDFLEDVLVLEPLIDTIGQEFWENPQIKLISKKRIRSLKMQPEQKLNLLSRFDRELTRIQQDNNARERIKKDKSHQLNGNQETLMSKFRVLRVNTRLSALSITKLILGFGIYNHKDPNVNDTVSKIVQGDLPMGDEYNAPMIGNTFRDVSKIVLGDMSFQIAYKLLQHQAILVAKKNMGKGMDLHEKNIAAKVSKNEVRLNFEFAKLAKLLFDLVADEHREATLKSPDFQNSLNRYIKKILAINLDDSGLSNLPAIKLNILYGESGYQDWQSS